MKIMSFFCILMLCLFIDGIFGDIIYDFSGNNYTDNIRCNTPYCNVETKYVFKYNNNDECLNPLLTLQFILTDFNDPIKQYISVLINDERLGFCTGNNETDLTEYYTCLEELSIFEITGSNPEYIKIQLQISPNVINLNKTIDGYLLDALTTITCDNDITNITVNSKEYWDPNIDDDGFIADLACLQRGCENSIDIEIISPQACRVPMLSLAFWLTGTYT